jgi:hypothetical protein
MIVNARAEIRTTPFLIESQMQCRLNRLVKFILFTCMNTYVYIHNIIYKIAQAYMYTHTHIQYIDL